MGFKAALLAFSDGDLVTQLRRADHPDPEASAAVVARVLPGYGLEAAPSWGFTDAMYPDRELVYAAVMPGVTLLADRRFMIGRPSELSPHLVELAAGRRITHLTLESTTDSVAVSVWEDGELIRSLSLSGDDVVEDIGTPLAFEEPFWAGERSHEPVPVIPLPGSTFASEAYRHGFHPLDLGEHGLHVLFGMPRVGGCRSGCGHPQVGEDSLRLHGWRAIDPSGAEQAEHAEMQLHARRMYRVGPDGERI